MLTTEPLQAEGQEHRSTAESSIRTIKDSSLKSHKQRTLHTHSDIWKWTLTQHAIAPCRVEDIYDLQECETSKPGIDPDYFWLGNVPCRSVLIYGMVVGVQVYEQRVVYTIDDGTGKIDCNLREAQKTVSKAAKDNPKRQNAAPADRDLPAHSSKPLPTLMKLPQQPIPVAAVGDIVKVVGRILRRRETRIINVDSLTLCRNATDEPLHWLSVLSLHETWYNSQTTTPFVIPSAPIAVTIASSSCRAFDVGREDGNERDKKAMPPPLYPVSPSKSSIAGSAPSSPSSVASSSVSGSSHHSSRSPPRLRHPSRLHTRDLTANTFRIYVKHYMDNAPSQSSVRPRCPAESGLVSDSSEDEDVWGDQGDPGTPTKHRRASQYAADLTPRPRKVGTTPRAYSTKQLDEVDDKDTQGTSGLKGYTLSHLRRVPELALLARRVVEAEYKRRAKEQRRKGKETQTSTSKTQSSSHSHLHSSYASTSSKSPRHVSSSTPTTVKSTSVALGRSREGEPVSAKIKRLFRYAVRQLYEEGSIVLWDGPVQPPPRRFAPIPRPSFTSNSRIQNGASHEEYTVDSTHRLWKIGHSGSISQAGNTSTFSTTITSTGSMRERSTLEGDLDDLSDPPSQEEAYIPLTSPYLAHVIEQAISEIMSRQSSTQNSRSYPYVHAKKGPPPPGPTVDELVRYLHRKDERWARVGEWAVKEALEWGKESGRVWCIGDGRWEVCG